jgi:hypothetical protein
MGLVEGKKTVFPFTAVICSGLEAPTVLQISFVNVSCESNAGEVARSIIHPIIFFIAIVLFKHRATSLDKEKQ